LRDFISMTELPWGFFNASERPKSVCEIDLAGSLAASLLPQGE